MSSSVSRRWLPLKLAAPSGCSAVAQTRTEALQGPERVLQLIDASLALLPSARCTCGGAPARRIAAAGCAPADAWRAARARAHLQRLAVRVRVVQHPGRADHARQRQQRQQRRAAVRARCHGCTGAPAAPALAASQ
jgi:hypothetical protein